MAPGRLGHLAEPFQDGRLADPGLAGDHDRPTMTALGGGEGVLQDAQVGVPAGEKAPGRTPGAGAGALHAPMLSATPAHREVFCPHRSAGAVCKRPAGHTQVRSGASILVPADHSPQEIP
jgi:hypothetical protein